jgi:hypothetical protein
LLTEGDATPGDRESRHSVQHDASTWTKHHQKSAVRARRNVRGAPSERVVTEPDAQ